MQTRTMIENAAERKDSSHGKIQRANAQAQNDGKIQRWTYHGRVLLGFIRLLMHNGRAILGFFRVLIYSGRVPSSFSKVPSLRLLLGSLRVLV